MRIKLINTHSAVATGLEKVSFHSNPKERQCQRMLKLPHNCTHLTCQCCSYAFPANAQNVVATCSGKQTHSEGQCRQWSAVYCTGGPKAESPLSQGPRPVFAKTLYTLSVRAQTHLPKFPETSLNKGKRKIQSKLTHDSYALSLGS